MEPRFLCDPDWIDIVGLILLIAGYLVATIAIIALIKLSTYKDEKFVQYRELPLTIAFTSFVIGELIINRTYVLGYTIFFWWGFNSPDVPPPFVYVLIYSVFWWTTFSLNALRIWKLYYIQQCNIVINDVCWVRSINKEHGDPEHNWFIQNRLTWGSTRWLMRIFVPFNVLSATCGPLLTALFSDVLWPHFLNFVWRILTLILSWTVLYAINKTGFTDIYGIKNELFYSTFLNTCSPIIYFSIFLSFVLSDVPASEYTIDDSRKQWLIYSFVGFVSMGLTSLITTIYPMYWDKRKKKSKYRQIKRMSMNEVFQNQLGFRLFMRYLVTEYSTESLLFIVELIQIQNYLGRVDNSLIFDFNTQQTKTVISSVFDIDMAEHGITNDIKLCKSLIISPVIVKQRANIKDAMVYIYNKYFSSTTKYPIAMSYENKVTIDKILFNLDHAYYRTEDSSTSDRLIPIKTHSHEETYNDTPTDDEMMIHLYDSVVGEVLYSLHGSFIRFQVSDSYVEYSRVEEQYLVGNDSIA
eukprot:186391_1